MLSLDVAKVDSESWGCGGEEGVVTSQRMELKIMENNGHKEAR